MSEEITTSQLVSDYMEALRNKESAEEALKKANKDLKKRAGLLGARLSPGDMTAGGSIAVWHKTGEGDESRCFLICFGQSEFDYSVTLRGEPKEHK